MGISSNKSVMLSEDMPITDYYNYITQLLSNEFTKNYPGNYPEKSPISYKYPTTNLRNESLNNKKHKEQVF